MKGRSIAALVLGIIGLVAWLLPLVGVPVTIAGLVLGIIALKGTEGKGMAVAGIVMSSLGLLLTIINSAIGAYLGATGQLF